MSRLGAKPSSSGHWTCVLLLVTSCYWLLLLHGGVESAYIRARRQPVKDDLSSSNSSNTQRFDEPFSSVNKTGANKPKRSPDDLHTFYQFLVSKGLNRFCKLLRQANIEDTLSSVGPFTLFAPTDEAFAFLPGKALEEIRTDVTKLRKFLLYHIVPGSISSVDIQNEKVINSADGSPIRFNVYSNGQVATASGAQIVEADIRHTNYIVHIVDHVLYPPPTLDIISQIKQKHDTLYRLLVSADFTDYLSGGTFTVFAPSDEAFRVLPKSIRDLLYTNITVLQRVLLNHIVPGTYFSPGLPVGSHLTSQSNVPLYITTARGLLLVNKIPIVESDVPVSNGVIHFLNRVLLPPDVIEDCNCLKPLSTTPSPNKDKNPTPQEEPNKDSGKPQQPSRSTKSPGGPQPDLPENEKPQSVDNPKEPKLNERNYPFNPLYPPDETSTDQKPNVPTSNQPDNPRTDKDRQQPFPQNPNEQRPPGFPYYPNNPEQSPTPNEQKPTSQQQPNDNQPQQPYYPNVPTNDQPLNKPAYEDYEGQPYPINPYEQSYPYNTPEQVPKRPSQQEPAVPIQTDSPSRQPSPPYFPNEEPFQPYPRPNVPPTGNEKTPGISPQLGQPQPNLQCSETPNAPECQYTPPQSGQPQPSIQCSEAPNAPECQYTPPQSGQPQPNIQCSETPNAPECQYAPPQSRPPPNLQCNETPNAPGCQYDTQPLQPNVLPTKIPTGPEDPQSKPSRPSLPRETKSPRIPPKYNTKSEIPESVTDPYGEQPQPDQYPKRKPNIPQSITKTPATEDELPTLGNPGNQYDKPQPYLPRKEQTPTDEKPPTSKEDSTPPTEEFYTPYTRGHTRAPTSILTSRATPQRYETFTTKPFQPKPTTTFLPDNTEEGNGKTSDSDSEPTPKREVSEKRTTPAEYTSKPYKKSQPLKPESLIKDVEIFETSKPSFTTQQSESESETSATDKQQLPFTKESSKPTKSPTKSKLSESTESLKEREPLFTKQPYSNDNKQTTDPATTEKETKFSDSPIETEQPLSPKPYKKDEKQTTQTYSTGKETQTSDSPTEPEKTTSTKQPYGKKLQTTKTPSATEEYTSSEKQSTQTYSTEKETQSSDSPTESEKTPSTKQPYRKKLRTTKTPSEEFTSSESPTKREQLSTDQPQERETLKPRQTPSKEKKQPKSEKPEGSSKTDDEQFTTPTTASEKPISTKESLTTLAHPSSHQTETSNQNELPYSDGEPDSSVEEDPSTKPSADYRTTTQHTNVDDSSKQFKKESTPNYTVQSTENTKDIVTTNTVPQFSQTEENRPKKSDRQPYSEETIKTTLPQDSTNNKGPTRKPQYTTFSQVSSSQRPDQSESTETDKTLQTTRSTTTDEPSTTSDVPKDEILSTTYQGRRYSTPITNEQSSTSKPLSTLPLIYDERIYPQEPFYARKPSKESTDPNLSEGPTITNQPYRQRPTQAASTVATKTPLQDGKSTTELEYEPEPESEQPEFEKSQNDRVTTPESQTTPGLKPRASKTRKPYRPIFPQQAFSTNTPEIQDDIVRTSTDVTDDDTYESPYSTKESIKSKTEVSDTTEELYSTRPPKKTYTPPETTVRRTKSPPTTKQSSTPFPDVSDTTEALYSTRPPKKTYTPPQTTVRRTKSPPTTKQSSTPFPEDELTTFPETTKQPYKRKPTLIPPLLDDETEPSLPPYNPTRRPTSPKSYRTRYNGKTPISKFTSAQPETDNQLTTTLTDQYLTTKKPGRRPPKRPTESSVYYPSTGKPRKIRPPEGNDDIPLSRRPSKAAKKAKQQPKIIRIPYGPRGTQPPFKPRYFTEQEELEHPLIDEDGLTDVTMHLDDVTVTDAPIQRRTSTTIQPEQLTRTNGPIYITYPGSGLFSTSTPHRPVSLTPTRTTSELHESTEPDKDAPTSDIPNEETTSPRDNGRTISKSPRPSRYPPTPTTARTYQPIRTSPRQTPHGRRTTSPSTHKSTVDRSNFTTSTSYSYTTSTTEAPAVSPEHPIPEIPELSFGGPDGETPNTVVDLLEKPNLTVDNKPVTFSVILTMMHDIGLPNILSNRGPFTMCIPTDKAFSGLPNGLLNQLQNNKNMLQKIILYHVVASRIPSTDLKENQILRTFQGPPLFVNVRNGGKMVLVGGSRVVGTKQTKEGVVYIMDRVLSTLPDDNVLTALRRRPHLSQFSNFLRESPLRNFLRRRGPFTLFAPTNEAWNSLPEEITNILATNATALNEVLFNHVVNGAHYTNAIPNNELLIPTPQGGTLKFRIAPDGAYVNSANILYPDISTGNGLVHVIDRVILTAPPLTTFERQGSNGQQPQTPQNHQPANKIDFPTLYNAADDMKINTFLGWLEQANLLNELHPDVNYTIFAPTDDAISALPPTLLKAINNDVNQLMPIVKYHVVPENIPAKKVHNEMTAPTLLPGKDVRFNFYQNHANLTVAGSPVGPEKKVGNILLTVVSRVLYPPSGDIYSTISKSPILQDLKQAITMAGLEDLLKGPGPFTVFAPTETAFRNLPKAEYLRFFNNPDLLRGLLLHHIVNGTVFLSGIDNGVTLTPLRGDKLNVTITPNHMGVNGLNILYSDITATNGVIHVLDHLLL